MYVVFPRIPFSSTSINLEFEIIWLSHNVATALLALHIVLAWEERVTCTKYVEEVVLCCTMILPFGR